MRLSIVLLFSIIAAGVEAQSGYKLDFKIKEWKDSTVYLGFYYGEQTNIKDTTRSNSDGVFVFDNKNTLPQGIYFLVLKSKSGFNKIFDFVIGSDQFFSMETSSADYIKNMVVKGDEDNQLFFDNWRFTLERSAEAEPFVKVLRDSSLTEDQKKPARESFIKVNEKVIAHQKELIAKNPKLLTVRLIKSNQQIDIPPPPKKANGNIDSTFQLRYYREHFFDNFDLGTEGKIAPVVTRSSAVLQLEIVV